MGNKDIQKKFTENKGNFWEVWGGKPPSTLGSIQYFNNMPRQFN